MPLDRLQIRIIRILKDRRSRQSFVGGSSVFNETYPRISNDIDIYAEDVPAGEIAKADADAMTADGLKILSLVHHYGFATDAMVTDGSAVTAIEWNEADRGRFYPIQRHETFGWALHKSDLAIQKLIAAATGTKHATASTSV